MVPPYSHRVSRVRRYSGFSWLSSSFAYVTLTLFRWSSHTIQLDYLMPLCCPYPSGISTVVWPLPRSLATTCGISVDFSSSSYLDVSVQTVPHNLLFIHKRLTGYCPAGFPHSEIHGSRTAFVSPWLIVDRYVLLRLPMPRHSPCALISLTFFRIMCPIGFC